ncbi:unnamed protein product [Ectocarpus fasciculatus]
MAAVAIDDDEQGEPAAQWREEHADAAWGSDDDGEHVYDYRPSRFSQPFGMGAAAAAAAGVVPTSPNIPPTSHATTSWGCDGEDKGSSSVSEAGDPSSSFSQPLRMEAGEYCATASAGVNPQQPLSPTRYYHHRHNSDEVVVAPLWMPHAQGQSELGEPDDLWADEGDGRSGDTSRPRGNGSNPNGVVAGGLGPPWLSPTLPALDDVDLTGDDENNSLEAADLAATYPAGRISTPLTMTPSPWFKASGRDYARQSPAGNAGSNDGDHGRGNPQDSRSASTPPRVGSGAWFGRWFTPKFPRRWRPPGAAAGSPMHEAPAAKYDFASNPQRPVVPPARDRGRSWLQGPSAFVERLRRKAVRELGPPRAPGGGLGANQGDTGPGVRAWGWWDNFKNAPGLIGRLAVCILAVCALWSTSLSVVVDVTSGVIPSPSLTDVITSVVHAYYIVQEQREASQECVARQSVYCDLDISTFEVLARDASVASLASTAATFEIAVDAAALLENVTFEIPASVSESLEDISALGDVLVSCVSLRGEDDDGGATTAAACPVESARELADVAREELDYQLEVARAAFQEYADTYEEYRASAEESYDNWLAFFTGVMQLLDDNKIDIEGSGPWSDLILSDFTIPPLEVPSASGVLSEFGDALTSSEIWEAVSGAYGNYSAGASSRSSKITADVEALREEWRVLANAALANITADSSALLDSAGLDFQAEADGYSASSLALLEEFGPAGPNLSFPASPSLNSTLLVGGASTVVSSPVEYTFAAFTAAGVSFDSWVVSLGNIMLLLLAADYIFRTASSLRLFVRFWGRGGLGLPDADVRVDKAAASAGGAAAGLRRGVVRVLIHPATTVLFSGVVLSLVLYNLASVYGPLFADYRAGCVEKSQTGSFFGQNVYSIAYNYAAEEGNRDQWTYQEDHTSRRGALCVELTADVRQYLAETDAQLRTMYEAHYDDVTAAAILASCIDTAGMDALYAEACCGYDGYSNDTCSSATANSSLLQCPLNYASGVGQAFGSLAVPLSDPACSAETLETANWKVEDGIVLDCDTIPTCRMTCVGPNEELLQAVTIHAGCMVEWFFHAGTVRLAATLLMFLFLNVSRVVLVGGVVKLNWSRLHPGVFTYKGTCTRAGELIVKNPEKIAAKSRDNVAATAAGKGTLPSSGKSPLARAKSRIAARAKRNAPLPSRGSRGGDNFKGRGSGVGDSASEHTAGALEQRGGVGGSKGKGERGEPPAAAAAAATVSPADAPREEPMTFKQVISGAIEEGLRDYENGARWRILFGILLNIPWMLVLWFGRGSNTAYVAE